LSLGLSTAARRRVDSAPNGVRWRVAAVRLTALGAVSFPSLDEFSLIRALRQAGRIRPQILRQFAGHCAGAKLQMTRIVAECYKDRSQATILDHSGGIL
jgi:hypothetical protein